MKQATLPFITAWRQSFHRTYAKIYAQITSPWTKLAVLAVLALLFTRKELSFSLSINGDSLLSIEEATVIDKQSNPERTMGANAGAGEELEAKLTAYVAPAKEWTAKQKRQLAYVDKYKLVALAEMNTHGIPASITLAQGLLESGTGKSTLARKNNNHFGIKCFSKKCRKGHCSNHSDDHHKDFFRKFESPEESFRAHSQVLMKDRYQSLFSLPITDYKSWSHGLRKAGYATDPRYGDKLIRMIESLELWRYDQL